MQAGTFGTVPAVSVLAFLFGRRAPGREPGGGRHDRVGWREARQAVRRAGPGRRGSCPTSRPRRHRGRPRLGLGPHRRRDHARLHRGRGAPRAVAAGPARIVGTVGFGRMYVGAHLPHDVVGGAGLGMMISAVIPSGRRRLTQSARRRSTAAHGADAAWRSGTARPRTAARPGTGTASSRRRARAPRRDRCCGRGGRRSTSRRPARAGASRRPSAPPRARPRSRARPPAAATAAPRTPRTWRGSDPGRTARRRGGRASG